MPSDAAAAQRDAPLPATRSVIAVSSATVSRDSIAVARRALTSCEVLISRRSRWDLNAVGLSKMFEEPAKGARRQRGGIGGNEEKHANVPRAGSAFVDRAGERPPKRFRPPTYRR